ncbi:MAG TPA: hypothetical protein VKK81_27765 [Candidatus Binatia bacterium]|nr:hypothetical protein [Candidatus Binatia bacterium]
MMFFIGERVQITLPAGGFLVGTFLRQLSYGRCVVRCQHGVVVLLHEQIRPLSAEPEDHGEFVVVFLMVAVVAAAVASFILMML